MDMIIALATWFMLAAIVIPLAVKILKWMFRS